MQGQYSKQLYQNNALTDAASSSSSPMNLLRDGASETVYRRRQTLDAELAGIQNLRWSLASAAQPLVLPSRGRDWQPLP
jgi:hypothetical protein